MTKRWSGRALDCARCPRDGAVDGSRGCPLWWKTIQANVATGEEKIWEECGFVQLPTYLVEVIKASNRPAAAVESCRNEIAAGLERTGRALDAERQEIRTGLEQIGRGLAMALARGLPQGHERQLRDVTEPDDEGMVSP